MRCLGSLCGPGTQIVGRLLDGLKGLGRVFRVAPRLIEQRLEIGGPLRSLLLVLSCVWRGARGLGIFRKTPLGDVLQLGMFLIGFVEGTRAAV